MSETYIVNSQPEAMTYLSMASKATTDPTYAYNIFLSYCTRKLLRGKSKDEVGFKLHILERQLVLRRCRILDLGKQVTEVRERLQLPKSRVFRDPYGRDEFQPYNIATASDVDRRRASEGMFSAQRSNNLPRASASASASTGRLPVVRPSNRENGASTPPPAYERTDPNQDSDLTSAIIASLSIEQHSPDFEQGYTPPSGPPPSSSSTNVSASFRRNGGGRSLEDPLLLLSTYHTYFLIDDSTSMQIGDRWADMVKVISSVVPLAANFDPEGVELHFVNSNEGRKGVRTEEEVEDIFARVDRPEGSTLMSSKLQALLANYVSRLENLEAGLRPLNLIIMTDGTSLRASLASNHNPFLQSESPESVIAETARRLDHGNYPLNQLGLFFLQIGDDAEAREFLQDMDDSLPSRHNVRDMVDTISFNGLISELNANDGELLRKILLGGVDKRIDREI